MPSEPRLDADRSAALLEIIEDPVLFARGVLGHDVWDTPAAIMAAMAQPRARVAVKACHASSKTFTAADVVVWALTRYPRVKVVTTAPTWHQVETLLWGEIHKAVAGAKISYPTKPNTTEWTLERGERFAEGLSTTESVRFQGYHADEGGVVIVVLDEAPGVRADIYEAIEGIRAGGDVRVLAIGNPVVASGPFYDAFAAQLSSWQTFSIDAFDTPNLRGISIEQLARMSDAELDADERSYLVTRRWVRERLDEWGEDHPMWQARVRAQFPTESDDAVFSLAWLEAARAREPVNGSGTVFAGLDVAGAGSDETSLWVREGPSVLYAGHWAHPDPRGDVLAALQPYRNRIGSVVVDVDGVGHYMAKHLEGNGIPVTEFRAGGAPRDKERYRNAKAEAYFGLRELLKGGQVNGLRDDKAIGQLASIRYRLTPSGQIEIEPKDQALKRGVRSPDRAEGLILSFVPTSAAGPRVVRTGKSRSEFWAGVRA